MGTGLDATFGYVLEEAYGTYKAPSKFIEVESFDPKLEKQYTGSRPLRGRPGVPVSRHKATTRSVAGSVGLEVPNQGFGGILNMLHGETVTPTKQAATKAYLQTHKIGVKAPNGKSHTVQVNKPTAGGNQAFTYYGTKYTQATFSCDTSAQLKCALTLLAADGTIEKSLAATSYPSAIQSRTFDEAIVTIGGEDVTASGLIIHSFSLDIPIPLHSNRFGLGRGGTQAEPIGFNDSMVPGLSLPCEFTNTGLFNHYINEDELAVVITFKGDNIENTYYEEISFELPKGKFVGEDPGVSGPDLLDQSASFTVLDDITDPLITVKYMSTDTAL